jgi:hypothetical protein
MKHLLNGAWHRNRNSFAIYQPLNGILKTVCLTLVIAIVLTACQKQNVEKPAEELQMPVARNTQADVLNFYNGLSQQTLFELQQARAATARYRDIKNAIKDGYSNINVDVPNMGHHFMNVKLIDGTFDISKPEILVYNGLDEGNPELIAVEYAVNYRDANGNITPVPEGFTGTSDVWKGEGETGFPFWLCHAWVWKYNSAGVFNWTNPSVDLD